MFEGSVQILDNDLTEFDEDTGPGEGWAIDVDDRANVLIDGNVMENADYGIYVEEINNLTISDNEIADSGWGYGIWLDEDVFSALIESVNVISAPSTVSMLSNCHDVIVGNNTISDSYEYGIYSTTTWIPSCGTTTSLAATTTMCTAMTMEAPSSGT